MRKAAKRQLTVPEWIVLKRRTRIESFGGSQVGTPPTSSRTARRQFSVSTECIHADELHVQFVSPYPQDVIGSDLVNLKPLRQHH